jgi:protein-tyrosine phosphatase
VTDLSGTWNFRDVSASTDGAVRAGRLFRSGELTGLDDTGVGQLQQLGVTDVADLRSPREIDRHGGDVVPDGVVVHLLPFIDVAATPGGDSPHEHAFQRLITDKPDDESLVDAGRRFMTEEYARFAKAPGARRAVHRLVELLGNDGAVLTHCFAGKDRTGFTVAVVLEAAGIDRATVMADYLRSNAAAPTLREQVITMIRRRFDDKIPADAIDFTKARLSDEVLGVREEYLETALRTIADEFGSVQGYLRVAGVTANDVDRLRTALCG